MQDEKSHYRGERRNCLRYAIHSLAYVRLGEENGGIVINLSEEGMAVQAVMAVAHDRMPVLLFPPASSRDSIETTGRIAWKRDAGKLAGIQFVDMPQSMHDLIRSWIAEESSPRAQSEVKTPARIIATLQKDLEAGVQKQASRSPVSVSAPAGPTSSFAAKNSTLPSPAMPRVASPRLSSVARPALLIIVVAALSFVAGWATVRSLRLSHLIDSSAGKANVRNQQPALRQPLQSGSPGKRGWIFLGHITPESTWAADSPKTIRSEWPIEKGDHITISHEVWMRDGSRPSAQIVGRLHFGDTALVEQVTLLHARVGGNFVWAKVSTAAGARPDEPGK
jgi:hypothetical protein